MLQAGVVRAVLRYSLLLEGEGFVVQTVHSYSQSVHMNTVSTTVQYSQYIYKHVVDNGT